jgi:hypothetical protein
MNTTGAMLGRTHKQIGKQNKSGLLIKWLNTPSFGHAQGLVAIAASSARYIDKIFNIYDTIGQT